MKSQKWRNEIAIWKCTNRNSHHIWTRQTKLPPCFSIRHVEFLELLIPYIPVVLVHLSGARISLRFPDLPTNQVYRAIHVVCYTFSAVSCLCNCASWVQTICSNIYCVKITEACTRKNNLGKINYLPTGPHVKRDWCTAKNEVGLKILLVSFGSLCL